MIKIFGKILFFFIFFNSTYALENKILFKIDNEIITSFDLYYEIEYLKLLNKNLSNLQSDKVFEIGKNSIIRDKIKEIELQKYYEKFEIYQNYFDLLISNLLKKLKLQTINDLERITNEKNINMTFIKEKITKEVLWNQLILTKYSKDIKINKKNIKDEILKKNYQKEYLLSEIVFNLKKNETLKNKFNLIKSEINLNGFSNAALIFSNSDTSQNGGNLGWIKLSSLNKKIKNKIKNQQIGDFSDPILIPGGFLIIKIEDQRNTKIINDIDKEVEIIANEIANKQLNQSANIFFNKIKQEVKIYEF